MGTSTSGHGRFSQYSKQALRNPWVIGWIAMVVLVLIINMFMISQAVITAPGLVNDQYYDKGKNYHKTVARRQQVESLGWDISVDRPQQLQVGEQLHYNLVAVDRTGIELDFDQVELFAYRPADQRADFKVAFEHQDAGRYSATVIYPLKGMWDVVIQVRKGELHHEIAQRTRVVEQRVVDGKE